MDLKQAYEQIWSGKLEDIQPPHAQSIERVEQVAALWREHFRDGRLKGPLLDVGCGSGAMLAKAKESGIDAMGVDFDGPLLDWLRGQRCMVVRRDLNVDPLPSALPPRLVGRHESAVRSQHGLNLEALGDLAVGDELAREIDRQVDDAVDGAWQISTCADVLEHLVDPDHLLREIYRVLAPGGHAYVSTPNCSWWKRVQELSFGKMFRTSGDQVLRDGGHLSYWAPVDLKEAMQRAGFAAVEIHYRNRDPAQGRWNKGEFSNYAYMIACGEKR